MIDLVTWLHAKRLAWRDDELRMLPAREAEWKLRRAGMSQRQAKVYLSRLRAHGVNSS